MKKQTPLAFKILLGMILGIVIGFFFQGNPAFPITYIKPIGTIFLNLIKLIVVPLVLFSIISGVISMKDIKKVGSVGMKTLVFYMVTTCIAVSFGLIFANLLKVGAGYELVNQSLSYEVSAAPSFIDTLINIFPSNIISPFANASMLQVIVISLFFGFGIIITGDKATPVVKFVESFNEICMNMMNMIIKLSPIGVFALLVPVIAENGTKILLPLIKLILVVYLVYFIHMVIVYSLSVKSIAKVSPATFFKEMFPAMSLAFSSASSIGALPLNLECTEKIGAKREVASFVLPLGATINMDGTAIYQGVCVFFIAQVFGFDLSINQQITIILTSTLASIGTAGVPGAGMIMLAMVLQSVGLPVEGIALIAGIDRILDMGRTVVNITGDAACAVCISAIEDRRTKKTQVI